MNMRSRIRTGRTLWRVYRHRKAGHVLLVDPGAVTCQTCAGKREKPCRCGHGVTAHGETRGCRICDCPHCWWSIEINPPTGATR